MDASEQAIQGVIETIDSAIHYRLQLSQLLDCLHESRNQVSTSASQARVKLSSHFETLRQCVTDALNERLATLQQIVDDAERSALEPLNKCQHELEQKVNIAVGILDQGKELLESEDQQQGSSAELMAEFKNKKKQIAVDSLPEVPSLWDVASISVDLPREDEHIQRQLVDAIRDYGRVLTSSPIQITDISERPAALLIKWAETGQTEDPVLDVFRLQFCRGAVQPLDTNDSMFSDVYEGPATSHLVRGLDTSVQYTFRVAGRSEGATSWSPWSLPVSWATTLPPHEWTTECSGYVLTDNNSTLTHSLDGATNVSTIYSSQPSYICGHLLQFHVSAAAADATAAGGCDVLSAEDGVGLCVTNTDRTLDARSSKGFVFYCFNGTVYADGQEKTTRLPAINSNSTVTFDTEVIQPNKVRVTIEVSEKVITFDWLIPDQSNPFASPVGGASHVDKIFLYFICRSSAKQLAIKVE